VALADDRNYREEIFSAQGGAGKAGFFQYNDKVIWGATARILSWWRWSFRKPTLAVQMDAD
jgi:hypothetical protein